MSTRSVLKSFFETGDTPTEAQFTDLIDSLAHLTDDLITQVEAEAGVSATPRTWSAQRVKELVDANPSGDVYGAASSVDENIVIFDGTTGKLIKDSGLNFSDLRGISGTAVSHGLEGAINGGDNTKFDIKAGLALIVNNYTDPENPSVTVVLKPAITSAITVTNLATQDLTFVGLNAAGNFVQQATFFTQEQKRDIAPIASLVHTNRTNIQDIGGIKIWNKDLALSLDDLNIALGRTINLSGNVYSANGANLNINKSAGNSFLQWGNYDNDRKDSSTIATIEQLALTFFLSKSTAGSGVFTDTVPNTQYEPAKDGVLVDLTTDYHVAHKIYWEPTTLATVIQYGQFQYDSQKKAVLSWDKECYQKAPELTAVQLRGIIIIKKGATDLSDTDNVKFIDAAALGDKVLSATPNFSIYSEISEIAEGMSYQRPSITYENDGGTLYADIEAVGTGDITYIFGQKEYVLNCTTGSGVGGRARIALTAGTATVEVINYVYVIKSGDVSILQSSISKPTGQFGWVCQVAMPDAITFNTTGPYSTQRISDNKSHNGRGALSYEREKLRDLGVTYNSGIVPTITITDLTPDTLDVSFTGGVIKQLNEQTFTALNSAADGIYIINHPTTPWLKVTDLETINIDANGDTLDHTAYNFVFIGISNSAAGVDYNKIGVLLPSGSYSYTDLQNALQDPSNTATTSVPSSIRRTAFLIARVTFKLKNGVLNNVVEDILTPQTFFDLRGVLLGASAGGAGAPSVSSFIDNVFNIISNISGFTVKFVLDLLTADRTLTVQDKNYTIADDAEVVKITGDQSVDGVKSFIKPIILDDSPTVATPLVGMVRRNGLIPQFYDNQWRDVNLFKIRINGDLNFYIESTGSDITGDGLSVGTAWETLQPILNYLKDKYIEGSITVNVGDMTLNVGTTLEQLIFNTSASDTLTFECTYTETLGSLALTATADDFIYDVLVSGVPPTWTINQYKGFLYFDGSNYYPISANTADTIEISNNSAVLTGSIKERKSIFTSDYTGYQFKFQSGKIETVRFNGLDLQISNAVEIIIIGGSTIRFENGAALITDSSVSTRSGATFFITRSVLDITSSSRYLIANPSVYVVLNRSFINTRVYEVTESYVAILSTIIEPKATSLPAIRLAAIVSITSSIKIKNSNSVFELVYGGFLIKQDTTDIFLDTVTYFYDNINNAGINAVVALSSIVGTPVTDWFKNTPVYFNSPKNNYIAYINGVNTPEIYGGILTEDATIDGDNTYSFLLEQLALHDVDAGSFTFTTTGTGNILKLNDTTGGLFELDFGGNKVSYLAAGILKYNTDGSGSYDDRSIPDVAYVNSLYVIPIGFAAGDEDSDIAVGTVKLTFRMPFAFTLSEVRANLKTAGTGSSVIFDIKESGTTIFSTLLSIDAGEKTSTTAATPAVISDANLANDAEITIDITQIGATIAGTGPKFWLIGTKA